MEDFEIESLPELSQFPQKEKHRSAKEDITEAAKTAGRLGLDALTTLGGGFGDVASLVYSPYRAANNYLAGHEALPEYKKIPYHLPTGEEMRNDIHEAYPETKHEEGSWGETLSNPVKSVTSLYAGGVKPKELLKLIGVSEGLGWVTEKLTGSKAAGDVARAGTILKMQLGDIPNKVKDAATTLYQKVSTEHGGARISSNPMQSIVNSGTKFAKSGLRNEDESRAFINSFIVPIKERMGSMRGKNKGTTSVGDVIDLIQDINDKKRKGIIPYRATPQVNEALGKLHDMLGAYGKNNPTLKEDLYSANQAWRALGESEAFTSALQSVRNRITPKSAALSSLFGYPAAKIGQAAVEYGAGHLGKIGAASAAAKVGYDVWKLQNLYRKSNVAKKLITQATKAAAKADLPMFARIMNELDDKAVAYESKHPYDDEEGFEIESLA